MIIRQNGPGRKGVVGSIHRRSPGRRSGTGVLSKHAELTNSPTSRCRDCCNLGARGHALAALPRLVQLAYREWFTHSWLAIPGCRISGGLCHWLFCICDIGHARHGDFRVVCLAISISSESCKMVASVRFNRCRAGRSRGSCGSLARLDSPSSRNAASILELRRPDDEILIVVIGDSSAWACRTTAGFPLARSSRTNCKRRFHRAGFGWRFWPRRGPLWSECTERSRA